MYFHTVYIGVNYKTPDKALEWINAIKSTNNNSLVVLVDNSRDYNTGLEAEIRSLQYLDVLYLDAEANLGYFNGAAFGYHYIKEQYSFQWVIVCNVDIVIETNDIDSILDEFPDAGVIAPAIISVDSGFDKNPYRLFRTSKRVMKLKKIVFSNLLLAKVYGMVSSIRNELIKNKYTEVSKCEEGTRIYLPYGACFIFSEKFFASGCKLDYPLFLFGEELYIAEQCREKELEIVYVPRIRFLNFEHASTSKLTSTFVIKKNMEAMDFILKNYYL